MDTERAAKVDVNGKIEEIKRFMPQTYAYIKEKASELGNLAYALVRRSLAGEPNCFYAVEAGRVMGTPFSSGPVPDHVAALMVQFGCSFLCIYPSPEGDASGTH